jgi:outer membrane lipoprotein carrier protein
MFRLILTLFSGLSFVFALAQEDQDPAAKDVLDRVAAKARQMNSIGVDFELVIEDRKENTKNSSGGSLLIRQDKYKITTQESVVYFDGRTMWTYVEANREVTITEPDNNNEEFLNNPAKIFSLYNRDFKYRYVNESTLNGAKYHEIDLFPKNLNQPYSRIKIFVSLKNEMPEKLRSVGKDGVDYTVNLSNFRFDNVINDQTFVFDPSKHKKVEVIDMRGVK